MTDAAGVGFNDPTPATPVGGNTGTTVGAQRLIVFQEAARIWGALLPSDVPIKVDSSFQALDCSANSAVLGSAGATTVYSDFTGAPVAKTWYNKPEADKLAGTSLGSTTTSIRARFNSELGKTGCLAGTFFYLGLDNDAGNDINLLTVVLHEFGHGLGFTSAADSTGAFLGSGAKIYPGIYDRFLLDETTGKTWDQMSDGERLTSGTNTGRVVWTGPSATLFARATMRRKAVLNVAAPASVAGVYDVGTADFGADTSSVSVTAPGRRRDRRREHGRAARDGRLQHDQQPGRALRKDRPRRPRHLHVRPEGEERPERGRRRDDRRRQRGAGDRGDVRNAIPRSRFPRCA